MRIFDGAKYSSDLAFSLLLRGQRKRHCKRSLRRVALDFRETFGILSRCSPPMTLRIRAARLSCSRRCGYAFPLFLG